MAFRIGLDARFFGPTQTGLGRYTQELVEHLQRFDVDYEFIVFLKKENFDSFKPIDNRFKKVLADFNWYTVQEQMKFSSVIEKENVNLMHFFHFNVPFFYRKPFVVTIHDLILLNYPTRKASTLLPFQYTIKYAAFRFIIRNAVKKAKHVIAVSEYTKKQILYHFDIMSDNVSVTYEAVHEKESSLELREENFLMHHGLRAGYFMYVGNSYPHKNIQTLLDAFDLYCQRELEPSQLVLVGKNDYFSKQLQQYSKQLSDKARKNIIFFGFASDHILSLLYKYASSYVFVSLEEGFGLPPLEAMVHDVPVICSHSSCLPEILHDACLYINPYDKEDIVQAMRKIRTDYFLRGILKTKGKKILSKYSWETCASQTLDIYHKMHAS